jgi:hypothetical protein
MHRLLLGGVECLFDLKQQLRLCLFRRFVPIVDSIKCLNNAQSTCRTYIACLTYFGFFGVLSEGPGMYSVLRSHRGCNKSALDLCLDVI